MNVIELEELRVQLGESGLVLVDVRSRAEHEGRMVAPCDPRPGRIPGSVGLPLDELAELDVAAIESILGRRDEVRVVAYCHSGARSAHAIAILSSLGFEARNYVGSWHEWSRDETLPGETG